MLSHCSLQCVASGREHLVRQCSRLAAQQKLCDAGVVHILDAVLLPDSINGGDDEEVDGNDDKDPNDKIPVPTLPLL